MSAEELLAALEADEMGRLRWKLCRLFGVAPWSGLGRSLTDTMCLQLAGQWVLDQREQSRGAENPAFDWEKFRKRKGEAT